MGIPKTLQEQKALAAKGFEYVNSGDYEHALIIAERFRKSRYTACFEIAALAHAGMEQKEKAVAVLEEGTSVAPGVWRNWELLGNYLSDLGRYEEAETALRRAMECPKAWTASILMNMAIVESRKGNPEQSLKILLEVSDPEVELPAGAIRIGVLEDLGRNEDLKIQASEVLAKEYGDDTELEPLARISASLGRVWLLEGREPAEIRAMLKKALRYDPCCLSVLDLIRRVDGRFSSKACFYRCLADFKGAFDDNGARGYFSSFDVIAEDELQAVDFIITHEDDPRIRKARVLETTQGSPAPEEALGIYSRTPCIFYMK